MDAPRALLEAVNYFADKARCNEFMIAIRWADGKVRCPQCDSDHVTYMASVDHFKCYGKHSRPQFSLKVGTIFEDSPLPLSKWLPAVARSPQAQGHHAADLHDGQGSRYGFAAIWMSSRSASTIVRR